MSKILCVVLLALQALSSSASQQCYFPNGTQASSSWDLLPCKTNSGTVNCCSHTDFCTSNGLCLDSNGDNRFTMQGCTDSSWDGCLQACDLTSTNPSWPYKFVFPCEADSTTLKMSYCCDSATCCSSLSTSASYNLSIATDFWRPPGATSTTTATSASSTGTSSSSSSSSSTGQDSSDGNQKLGLGLGLGLGIPFAAAVAVASYLGYRFRKDKNRGKSADSSQPSMQGGYPQAFGLGTVRSPTISSELGDHQPKSELGTEPHRYELFSDA